ncbi:MAG: DegQ family serine endoprotease [Verrucomicrobia bacterium]|nr:DegQ family serine endoprotease [Verrucomicrobiota bacterium]
MNTTHSLLPFRRIAVAIGVFALAGTIAAVAAQGSSATLGLKRDDQPVSRGALERASFSDVVKRVSPSVVKITTQTKAKRVPVGGQQFPGFDDPTFRQFFGGRVPEMRSEPQSGLGSGVIISADGYIVTNNHVIDGADNVTVALSDGRELTAKVVGRDPLTDIAVVKVDAKGLPAVTFADSSKIEVGDRVLAIGNPFGIGETVTSGIVSATGRRVGILADVQGYENFIQTDAAINPGNSGGALVDIDGRLIGINTAILSRSGGFQGVGLAVPSEMVTHVADSLVASGKVVRGYLGVNIQNITPALAESLELKNREGALVAEVLPDGPAAKAGLKSGDVITSVNGQKVTDSTKVSMTVSALKPGSKVNLEIVRDGQTEKITATTAERPGAKGARKSELFGSNDEGVLNGVAVADIDRDARRGSDLPARLKGALITNVDSDSAAARAGLRPGDVILEINRQPVHNAQEAIDLSAKAESKKTLVKLWSRGSTIFVVVDETGAEKAAQ